MSVLNQSGEEQVECPLCMEPLEVDDLNFYPCTCGYQICRFCWHRIRTDENGLCPACRKPYSENPADFTPLSQEQVAQLKQEKRQRDQQRKAKLTESRKHLASVRVVQRNLVFVVGLPMRLADAEVLKKHEYFGKFGKIHKVVINQSTTYAGSQGPSASAYVTYLKSDDALRAIQSVNNITLDGRLIKSSLGTTKYCSHFMKNQSCPKSDCMYLHDYGDSEASFTKEQMQVGRHQEYEKKLHDALLAKMALQSAPPGNGNGTQSTEKAGSPTGQNTAKTKDSKENKETWPQLNTDTNGTNAPGKGNGNSDTKDTTSSGTNGSTSKSKDQSNGKSGNRSNKAKTKRNNNNNHNSSNNNNSNSSANNCHNSASSNHKTDTEVVKESGHRLSDSESVSTSSSLADLPVTGMTHSGCSSVNGGATSSNSTIDSQSQRVQSAASLLDDNNSFFSSQNSFQRLDMLQFEHNIQQQHQLQMQQLQDEISNATTPSTTAHNHHLINHSPPPPIPTTSATTTTNTHNHLLSNHHNHHNHLLQTQSSISNHHSHHNHHHQHQQQQQQLAPPTVIDTMEERWEAAFGFTKHSNHLEELAQQRTGSVVGKQVPQQVQEGVGVGVGVGGFGGGGGGGGGDRSHVQYSDLGGFGANGGLADVGGSMSKLIQDYCKILPPPPNGVHLQSSQQNGYNSLHNGFTEKTLLYLHQQQQQQRQLEEQIMNITLKNQQQQQFHRLGNLLPSQPSVVPQQQQQHPYLNGLSYHLSNNSANSAGDLLLNGYSSNTGSSSSNLFGIGKLQQQRSLPDDELGFDPFQESQKGLAEFIENEQSSGGNMAGKMHNSNTSRTNLSNQINGLVHGQNGLSTHHLPPPPPGFSQSTTHMNSFGSKILPFLNMTNQQQQQIGNLTGNNWTNSYNHIHQQQTHKGLNSGPQQQQPPPTQPPPQSCNDWKILDPAILSSSRHMPPVSNLRGNNSPTTSNGTTTNHNTDYLYNNQSSTSRSKLFGSSDTNNANSFDMYGNSAAALAAMAARYQLEQQQQQQVFNQQFYHHNTHAQISSPPPGFRSAVSGAANSAGNGGPNAATLAGGKQEC